MQNNYLVELENRGKIILLEYVYYLSLMQVTGVTIINTHHSIWGGFASKHFEARLRLWENPRIWHSVLKGTLEDTHGKVTLKNTG